MRDYDSLYNRLLLDLGLQATDIQPYYHSDSSFDDVAGRQLASSFYKKLCPKGNTVSADYEALKKFRAINDSIESGPFVFEAENEPESCFWDYFRNEVALATDNGPFGREFDFAFIGAHMGLGPGANQKADNTSVIHKLFNGDLTYTNPDLIGIYRNALAGAGLWAEAEMLRSGRSGFVRVNGGKIFFAPKNREISRTCCTEATLNMLVQVAVGAFLEQGLGKMFGIYLNTQPDLNRELARRGSFDEYGDMSPCTVDSVSASDSIRFALTTTIVRNALLSHCIKTSRCERAVLPDGSCVDLNMVSTMGNGFTFPLQTLIFASAVKAVYDLMGIPSRYDDGTKTSGVFGDDIVVVRKAYPFLIKMLSKLGFTVNTDKSFGGGPFRESCGHDYFRGRNVRGVYVKSLETDPMVYSLINRLNRWTASTGIDLPSTIQLLNSWVRFIPVPPSEADDAGYHVPFELSRPKVDDKYWFKYRCFVRRRRRVKVQTGISPETDVFTDLVDGVGFLSGVYRRRDRLLKITGFTPVENREFYSDGCVQLTLREPPGAVPRYQIVNKTLPYWDFLHTPKSEEDPAQEELRRPVDDRSYGRWRAAVARALLR